MKLKHVAILILSLWSSSAFAVTFTVKGKLFYPDSRCYGRFDWHKTTSGATASSRDDDNCASATSGGDTEYFYDPDGDGDSNSTSLSARHFVVDVWDWDGDSHEKDQIGSITVNSDGSFSKSFSYSDSDGSTSAPEVVVSVRLMHKPNIKVVNPDGDYYWLWWSGYDYDSPTTISSSGTTLDIGTRYFSSSSNPVYEKAANAYASLTEVYKYTELDNGIDVDEYVPVYFPSEDGSTYHSGGNVYLEEGRALLGRSVNHEFGHAIHYYAWGGTTGKNEGYCYGETDDGDCAHSFTSQEYRSSAFKEGWAEFVNMATLNLQGSTSNYWWGGASSIENWAKPNSLSESSGDMVEANVTMALLDWLDNANDDHASASGTGDHFTATFSSIHYNLKHMIDDVSSPSTTVLGMDEYCEYYTSVRKPENLSSVKDLVRNNWMNCGL